MIDTYFLDEFAGGQGLKFFQLDDADSKILGTTNTKQIERFKEAKIYCWEDFFVYPVSKILKDYACNTKYAFKVVDNDLKCEEYTRAGVLLKALDFNLQGVRESLINKKIYNINHSSTVIKSFREENRIIYAICVNDFSNGVTTIDYLNSQDLLMSYFYEDKTPVGEVSELSLNTIIKKGEIQYEIR